MMKCHEIEFLLATRRDLAPGEESLVQQHLAGCSRCAAAWREQQRTTSLLRALPIPAVLPPARVASALEQLVASGAPVRRRRLWHPSLAAALLGIVLLLVLASRLLPPDEPLFGGQSLDPANPSQPTPPVPQGVLYVASLPEGEHGDLSQATLTAYNSQSNEVLYSFQGADDVLLAWDAAWLYVSGPHSVAALDALTGQERWRTTLEQRIQYPASAGPSALGLSPDGRWLFVVSYNSSDSSVPLWLQVLDTQDGRLLPETISLPDCQAPELAFPLPGRQPESDYVYVVCADVIHYLHWSSRQIRHSVRLEELHPGLGRVQDALLEPEGILLTLVTSAQQLVTFDTVKRALISRQSVSYEHFAPYAAHLSYNWATDQMALLQLLLDTQGSPAGALLSLFNPHGLELLPTHSIRISQPLQRGGIGFRYDSSLVYAASDQQLIAFETDAAREGVFYLFRQEWLAGQRIVRLLSAPLARQREEFARQLTTVLLPEGAPTAPPPPTAALQHASQSSPVPCVTATPGLPLTPTPIIIFVPVTPTPVQAAAPAVTATPAPFPTEVAEAELPCVVAPPTALPEAAPTAPPTSGDWQTATPDTPPPPSLAMALPTPVPLALDAPPLAEGLLYLEYSYFQLEGVPPYPPSQAIPMSLVDRHWVDTHDPSRSRHERSYRTHAESAVSSLMGSTVSTGSGGQRQCCEIYAAESECTSGPITQTLSYEQWLAEHTRLGRRLVESIGQPDASYSYKGVSQDTHWGEVHVFERTTTIEDGERYRGKPSVETVLVDTRLLRVVEQRREVVEGEVHVLYTRSRLERWEVLDPSQVPAELFRMN